MPWAPQPGPQTRAIDARWCPELFYGGARGGGKTDYLLGDFGQDVGLGDKWRGVLFRESYPELEEVIARSKQMYPAWFPGAAYSETSKTWRFPTGSELRLRYVEREDDADSYQGHQYTWIGWDELPKQKNLRAYMKLFACLRSAHGVPHLRIRATGNPGGASHTEVKERFITPAPMGYEPIRDGSGMMRMFVPSRVQDNAILLRSDPGYISRLHMVGSPELVRAWLDGDWDAVEGAFFPEFAVRSHVVAPCELPRHWTRFRAADWGSARPFSVGWYAVSDGELPQFPRGALVRYREWYGVRELPDGKCEPNVGLKMTAEKVADGIREREAEGERIVYGVLDPACFAVDGGPSIAERMLSRGVVWQRADNRRVGSRGAMVGWDQVRARLAGEDGRPMLYLFSGCRHLIRTLPSMQHDRDRPEDLDTDGEDHAVDELRYACMSRPWVRTLKPEVSPRFGVRNIGMPGATTGVTFNELRDQMRRKRVADDL